MAVDKTHHRRHAHVKQLTKEISFFFFFLHVTAENMYEKAVWLNSKVSQIREDVKKLNLKSKKCIGAITFPLIFIHPYKDIWLSKISHICKTHQSQFQAQHNHTILIEQTVYNL